MAFDSHYSRDVPDVRFQLARYVAAFYYLLPDPAKMLNITGYHNRIFYLLM